MKEMAIFKTFKELLAGYSPAQRRKYFLLLGGASLATGLELAALALIGLLCASIASFDSIRESGYFEMAARVLPPGTLDSPLHLVGILALAVVSVILLKNVTAALLRHSITKLNFGAACEAAAHLLDRIHAMPYQWLTSKNTAMLMTHINWRINSGSFMQACQYMVGDFVLVVVLFGSLILLNPTVVISVIIVLGGLSTLVFKYQRRSIIKNTKKRANLAISASGTLHKLFYGQKDVRIFDRGNSFRNEYADNLLAMSRLDARISVLQQVSTWVLEFIGFSVLGGMATAIYGISGLSSQKVIGLLTVAALAAWRGLPAIIRIIQQLATLQSFLPTLTKVFELEQQLDTNKETPTQDVPRSGNNLTIRNDVELQDIQFAYQTGVPVLHGVSLKINKGEAIGLVGPSGSGKSTLVDIVLGFLKPSEGTILLDGKPLGNDRTSWMRSIGYVPQSPYIFDGTLAENVAFATPSMPIDRDRVLTCCRQAQVTEFLDALPQGMDTNIGDRGLKLSGGQQQRICIARALYNNPEILIFDEATSSLDSRNEKSILKTIFSFQGERTLIIVAHRLSTVRQCNRVAWISSGHVERIGSADEILPVFEAAQREAHRLDCENA